MSGGTDAGIVFGEINPDVYAMFFDGGDCERMNTVHAYFKNKAVVENGNVAAVWLNGRYFLCVVKYINDTIELYDPRTGKAFAAVSAQDRFAVIGKLYRFGRDFVTSNIKAAEDVGK